MYGEADAALRERNNEKLHQTEQRYAGVSDRLFPERDIPHDQRELTAAV
jgi:hypothetical protein